MAEVWVYADGTLYGLGALVALVGLGRWVRGGRRDPLRHATERPNQLQPTLLALPLAVYLLASFAFQLWLFPHPSAVVRQTTLANAGNGVHVLSLAACLWVAHRAFQGGISGFVWGRLSIGTMTRAAIVGFLVSIALCAAILLITEPVFHWLLPDYEFTEHATLHALEAESPTALETLGLYIGAAVIAPLAEECFFRGLLQTALVNLFPNRRWLCIASLAMVFGLLHGGQLHAVAPLTIFGIILGYLYERYGALAVPLIIHVLFNVRTLIGSNYA